MLFWSNIGTNVQKLPLDGEVHDTLSAQLAHSNPADAAM